MKAEKKQIPYVSKEQRKIMAQEPIYINHI